MNFNALLQNRQALYAIIGAVVLIIVLFAFLRPTNQQSGTPKEEIIKIPMQLLETDSMGKAIEIQAILAKEGIEADRQVDGSKSKLILQNYTMSQRDRALLAIVRNGVMDKHIGLEIFDKGDFTSSKEDKRIRLVRAINGELSRLIRKIPPIEDASVFISIPEQTIFVSMEKPIMATVQITIPSGEKLDKDKVRTIANLLMGSIQGMEAKNISITDTNGNVYSSVMSAEEDRMSLLEENDQYMKTKVMVQLDRLLGKGNYVVTVSTYLRESPLETSKTVFNPGESSVMNEQKFIESLGDKSEDGNKSSAVSTYIPGNLSPNSGSSSNRNYSRSAMERQYGVGKTQISEVKSPGMMEEISIAVTLDKGAMPPDITMDQLKELVSRAASPKVKPANVEVAFSEMSLPFLSSERPAQLPKPEGSGNPWWTVAIILGIFLILGLVFISSKVKNSTYKQQQEIHALMQRTELQENQIKEAQEKAVRLQSLQEQMQHSMVTSNQHPATISNLQETIDEIKNNIDEKEFPGQLKSWIESTG
ncbi:MAG: flagellar M-ring protein FliF C-terminal domain-containing protein [bacterium]